MGRLINRHVAPAIVAGLLAAGLLAPAAGATKLGWNELARDGKTPIVSFRVTDLTIGATSWRVEVSFRNISKQTITVGDRFGVAFYASARATDLNQAIGLADALTFSPARPARLEPGASWTGVIAGLGRLKASDTTRYARVVFGPLGNLPGQKQAVFWVTDHAMPIVPKVKGPVI